MREIKFRQWCSRDKQFHYWGYLDGNSEFFENPLGYMSKDNPRESQQFTGLLDKNGKEIYEGDILDGDYYDEVFWDERRSQWMLRNEEDPNETLWEIHNNGETEVIGNIYENPELLK